jgi:hypothetical protein
MLTSDLAVRLFLAIIAHFVGDYILQSSWMAKEKTKHSFPAAAHALTYTMPFLLVTVSWQALLVIGVSHFYIDRYRLARYVCWAKNYIAPRETTNGRIDLFAVRMLDRLLKRDEGKEFGVVERWWHPWSECSTTGYDASHPAWMAVWLMIIADNTIHLAINAAAIALLGHTQ